MIEIRLVFGGLAAPNPRQFCIRWSIKNGLVFDWIFLLLLHARAFIGIFRLLTKVTSYDNALRELWAYVTTIDIAKWLWERLL